MFFGSGAPTVLGAHPDGPEREYLIAGVLGPPPAWLIADLAELASRKLERRGKKAISASRNRAPAPGASTPAIVKYAEAALASEVAEVAAAPEGTRNSTLWSSSCAIGSLVGAGAVDRAAAEERLTAATSLPPEEAADVVRRGLDKGSENPRDLGHVGRNGDGLATRTPQAAGGGEPGAPGPESTIDTSGIDTRGIDPVEAADDPHRLARLYRDERCLHADGTSTVRYWQGGFLMWEGAYRMVRDHEIHAELAQCCKREFDRLNREAVAAWLAAGRCDAKGDPCPPPVARKVTKTLVTNVALALGGYSLLDGRTENPAWLTENPPFPATEVLPCQNHLVHLPGWVAGAAARAPGSPIRISSGCTRSVIVSTPTPLARWSGCVLGGGTDHADQQGTTRDLA